MSENLNNLDIRYITHFCYDLQPSIYYRRKILDKIGNLDESYLLQMDAEFFMRVGLNCRIRKVEDLLSMFREHTTRKSNLLINQEKVEDEFFRRYSKMLRSFQFTDELIKDAKKLNIYDEKDIYLLRLNKQDKKDIRREEVFNGTNRMSEYGPFDVILYIGDAMGDFPKDNTTTNKYILPNPMYGKW